MLNLDRIEADIDGLLQHSNEWRSRYWAEQGPALISELREARELLRDWLAADGCTDDVLRIPRFVAVNRRTKAFLEDQ